MISFLSTEHSSCTFHPTIAAVKWTAIPADNCNKTPHKSKDLWGVHHIFSLLLIPQRIDGMQSRGLHRGQETEYEYGSGNTAHQKCEKALRKLREAIKDFI